MKKKKKINEFHKLLFLRIVFLIVGGKKMKKINKFYGYKHNCSDNGDYFLVNPFYTHRDNDRFKDLFKIWTPGSDKLPPWQIGKEGASIYV